MSIFTPIPYANGSALSLNNCPEQVRDFLVSLTTTWTTEGSILKRGSRSTVIRAEIDGSPYILKIYKKMAFHRRLRYALTQSRAFQSWNSGQCIAEAEVPVARPLAILEERQFGIPGRAILVMPEAKGDDLLSLVEEQKLSTEELASIAQKLTEAISKMKDALLTHGDMKATNILIDTNLNPMFIDIDGAIQHRSPKRFREYREKDRARFMKNWQTHPEAQEAFRDVFGKIQ